VFWDVFGESGHPVRATISDMGPLLLARLLNLNETQSGVLTLVFKIADDNGLLLLDLKDLRAMTQFVGDNAKQFTTEYGNISAASVGAIQRGLGGGLSNILFGRTGPRGGQADGLVQAAAKSVARTIGSSVGREIVRGVLGSLLGGRSSR
jgi:hypothetical protein